MSATVPQFGHLTRSRSIRFTTIRKHREIWNKSNNAARRLPYLLHLPHHYHCYPPHPLPSLRSRFSLSPPPFRLLFGFCSPSSSSPLSSMTSPQAVSNPPPSSPIKTVWHAEGEYHIQLSEFGTDHRNTVHLQSGLQWIVRVVIKGRVQGVFYRNWTVDNATELGLKGWVRNRRDGSVEALFSGNPDSVQEMEQRCRRGPSEAMVTALEVFPCTDDPGTGFVRKKTA